MKILIALATYNRPIITEVCLKNLSPLRSNKIKLVIYDDFSTAYDEKFLSKYADEIVRFKENIGIERSRAQAIEDFLTKYQDYDLLYFTDNDAVHDPFFIEFLTESFVAQKQNGLSLPVSLYNSKFHNSPDNIIAQNNFFLITKSIAGISQCFNREMVNIISSGLKQNPHLKSSYNWDYNYINLLKRPSCISKISYVEHFARDKFEAGMHSENNGVGKIGINDFERDRAINPSPFLYKIRESIIKKILF